MAEDIHYYLLTYNEPQQITAHLYEFLPDVDKNSMDLLAANMRLAPLNSEDHPAEIREVNGLVALGNRRRVRELALGEVTTIEETDNDTSQVAIDLRNPSDAKFVIHGSVNIAEGIQIPTGNTTVVPMIAEACCIGKRTVTNLEENQSPFRYRVVCVRRKGGLPTDVPAPDRLAIV